MDLFGVYRLFVCWVLGVSDSWVWCILTLGFWVWLYVLDLPGFLGLPVISGFGITTGYDFWVCRF